MNKLTKISRAVLAIAMTLMVALPSLAHDFEVDGIFYNYLNKTAKTVEVTFGTDKYTSSVTIPSSVTYSGTTYSVTSIGNSAFEYCTSLSSITIPNSVTSIGEDAFYNCTHLTEVNISDLSAWCKIDFGNSDSNPLNYTKKLKLNGVEKTYLVIPNDITKIKRYAFEGYSSLSSVVIPNSVTEIGISAFHNCSGLTSVTIPNSVTKIGGVAFSDCSGLTEVTIGNSVTSIGIGAFYNCSGLTSITIPNSVTFIDLSAFRNCSGLTSLTIPNSVTSIGKQAFCYCTGLTSATIGNSVTSIGSEAFYGCTGLTSVTIPNSVTSIGSNAFSYCTGLTSATIGNSVTSIGSNAFSYCSDLNEVNFNAKNCTSMGNYGDVFEGCTALKTLNIGNNVKTIPSNAFYGLKGLTSVIIPNSVTEIGDYAFANCTGLTEVTIGYSVTKINDAFGFNNYILSKLETLVSLNRTPPATSLSSDYDYSNVKLYVPRNSKTNYYVDDSWRRFSKMIEIGTLVSSVTLNNTELTIDLGSDYRLIATTTPSNATIPNLSWKSDNSTVATVDQYGNVTGISAGTATITVKANDGSDLSATCKVTVMDERKVPTITLSQTEAKLQVDETMTLSYSITNSVVSTATWSTSNENIAYVTKNSDGSARIVGMSDGVAFITAKLVEYGDVYTASCKVLVGEAGVEGVEVDNIAIEVARYDIHGRLLSEPTKGINIVKYSDGTTRKEIVK